MQGLVDIPSGYVGFVVFRIVGVCEYLCPLGNPGDALLHLGDLCIFARAEEWVPTRSGGGLQSISKSAGKGLSWPSLLIRDEFLANIL